MAQPVATKHSKELQSAIQDEARRREIDAAKKRAAAQNADYPTFAALVSMAHIKPFERKNVQESKAHHISASPAWTFDASGRLSSSQRASNEFKSNIASSAEESMDSAVFQEVKGYQKTLGNPTSKVALDDLLSHRVLTDKKRLLMMTCDAFKKEWRRATNFEEKLGLLTAVSHELSRSFKVELPPSILADIIDTLYWWKQCSSQEQPCHVTQAKSTCTSLLFDIHLAIYILESLPSCGRFLLSLKLAGPHIQACALSLIDYLITCLRAYSSSNESEMPLASTSEATDREIFLQAHTLSSNKMKALKALYTV